jgi:hypothetical protein
VRIDARTIRLTGTYWNSTGEVWSVDYGRGAIIADQVSATDKATWQPAGTFSPQPGVKTFMILMEHDTVAPSDPYFANLEYTFTVDLNILGFHRVFRDTWVTDR